MAGPPDDLAGLGERGPFAASPVFDGGVVGVVGGGGVGTYFACLVGAPAQHRRGPAGQGAPRAPAVRGKKRGVPGRGAGGPSGRGGTARAPPPTTARPARGRAGVPAGGG